MPTIKPDFTTPSGRYHFARARRARERPYEAAVLTSRWSRRTVSVLWFSTAGPASMTRSRSALAPLKSGISTSTSHSGTRFRTSCTVLAKMVEPPSGRSSRLTDVITAWRSPMAAIASATRTGSCRSSPCGRPVVTSQKPHARVQTPPRIMMVAAPSLQHS